MENKKLIFILKSYQPMMRTFLKDKQNMAKIQLLTIAQQDTNYDRKWLQSPHLKAKVKQTTKSKNKKTKTEVSSPRSRLIEDSKQALKVHLQQLKKPSLPNCQEKEPQLHETKSIPLKIRHFNNEPHKTVEEIYISKQRSEEKMRPLIYIEDFKKEYEEQQQKLRTIIKRKILAKDLFRKIKPMPQRNDSVLSRNFSQKQACKKNLLFARQRNNLLPHIF